MTGMQTTRTKYHCDDYAVWPDGTYATLDEVRRGEYNWMSDDYEIVVAEDDARLTELGIEELVPERPRIKAAGRPSEKQTLSHRRPRMSCGARPRQGSAVPPIFTPPSSLALGATRKSAPPPPGKPAAG